ncbi:MAG: hypothetical protein IKW58_01925 [Alphaproteobacteria bacterium]|nr:hypothetical protein [Alphaproteobacteria bacterium]
MNVEKYIEILRKKHDGKSFSLLVERCETSDDAPYRIKRAEILRKDEVVVLCLAGNGGDSINLRGYNSFLKKVDEFVKSKCGEDVRIVGGCSEFGDFHNHRLARKGLHYKVSWPNYYEEFKRSISPKIYKETFEPNYIKDIFDAVLERRLVDDNGKRLKIDDALRNVRRVNIVCHCHGGYVAMCLEDMMDKRMDELGYDKNEQKKLKEQLLVVAYNPDCPYVVSQMKFIGVVSSQDNHNLYNNYMREWLLMEPRDFGVIYMPHRWGRTIMCDKVNKNIGKEIEKNEKVDLFDFKKKQIGEHDFLGFKADENMSESGKLLQRYGGNILVNGVRNSLKQDEKFVEIPDIEKLVVRNFRDRVLFAKACIVGLRLEQKLYKVDRKKIDAYANWRRSLPVVTLD